jgi:iron complex outermembrane receptor protein
MSLVSRTSLRHGRFLMMSSMRRSSRARLFGSAALLIGLAAPAFTPAYGQSAPVVVAKGASTGAKSVEEVIVNGRHRSENKQKVPIAITAIGGKSLVRQHVERLNQYLRVVPNFTVVSTNPRVSQLDLRGVGGNANNDGSESAVGLIIDGIFFGHVGFAWLELVDLDHIELLRGPQGTLLGKNTTVGALNITTNSPTPTPSASLEFNVTNHDGFEERGVVNGPLIAGKLDGRLMLYDTYNDGFIYNHYNGNDYQNEKRYGARGELLFTPTDDLTDRLIFAHYKADEYSNYVSTLSAGPEYATTLAAKTPPGTGFTAADVIDGVKDFNQANQSPLTSQIDGVSNQLDWKPNGWTFSSISGIYTYGFRPYNNTPDLPFAIQRTGYDVYVAQYSEELRFESPTGGPIDYQGGLYGLREQIDSKDRTIYYPDSATYFLSSLAHPNISPNALAPGGQGVTDSALLSGVEEDKFGQAATTSLAAYLHGTWHITDQANLTLGYRDTYEWKTSSDPSDFFGGVPLTGSALAERVYLLQNSGITGIANTSSGLIAVKNANGTYGFKPYPLQDTLGDTANKNSISWLFNPSYKITPDIMVYAAVAEGEKSGAAVTNAIAFSSITDKGATVPLFTKPEVSTDWELGVKSRFFNNRLEVNANFYWDDIDQYQTNVVQQLGLFNGTPVVATYLSNAPHVRLRGLELETRAEPIDGLTVNLNFSFNDARFVAFPDAPAAAGSLSPVPVAGTQSQTGDQIPNAPRLSGNVGFNYDYPISDRFTLNAWANEAIRDRVYFASPFIPQNYQNSFGLTDFGFGVRTADNHYSVGFFVTNAFNKTYATTITGSQLPTASTTATLGDPRFFGGTFKVNF